MNSLTIVCGSPASGKSTYAAKLAEKQRATLLDIDTCSEQLVQLALAESGRDPNDRDSKYFKEKFRDVIYTTVFTVAQENIIYTNVIIVGPFTKEILNPDWPATLEKLFNLKPSIHFLYCEPETRKLRMAKRSNARDISKLGNWEEYLRYYAGDARPSFEHVFIDNSK